MKLIKIIILIIVVNIIFKTNTVFSANCGGATVCACGDTITSSYTLTSDLSCNTANNTGALQIGANSITLNGGGFSLTGTGGRLFGTNYGIRNSSTRTNYTITNFANISGFTRGINITAGSGMTISNNTISNNYGYGIQVQSVTSGLTISNNTFRNNSGDVVAGNLGGAIYLFFVTGASITGNTSTNDNQGIRTIIGSSIALTNNTVSNSRVGSYIFDSSSGITADTTNLSEGYPIYYRENIRNQTFDGDSIGRIGMFQCLSCSNIIVKNFNISSRNNRPIYLTLAASSTITNNDIQNSSYGIELTGTTTGSNSNNLIYNNRIEGISDANAIRVSSTVSTSTITVRDNYIKNSRAGLYLSGSGVSASNNTFSNIDYLSGTISGPTLTNNRIIQPYNTSSAVATMLQWIDPVRYLSVGGTASFEFNMYDATNSACSACTYTLETYPSETITSNKSSNNVTGSFVPTESGTYSLRISVTDSSGNSLSKSYKYFVGSTNTFSLRSYMHNASTSNQFLIRGNGLDSQIMNADAPTSLEQWWCSGWVQNSLATPPSFYPISYINSITASSSYYAQTDVLRGVQRYGNYASPDESKATNATTTLASSTAGFISNSYTFSGLNWSMDSLGEWYGLTYKIGANTSSINMTLQSSSTNPSYLDTSYSYTLTPIIASTTNKDINILSASASTTATTTASLTLENNLTSEASTTITIPQIKRPFTNATSTIYATGTTTVLATVSSLSTSTLETVPMDIIPSTGNVITYIREWDTSDDGHKEWTESSASSAMTSAHSISGLIPDRSYTFSVDGTSTTTYTTDSSGVLTFTYSGGYSDHTFTLDPTDITAPTITTDTALGTLSYDTSSKTFTWTTDELAVCRIGVNGNQSYSDMGNTESSSSLNHSYTASSLSPNTSYSYYVRCTDSNGNVNTSDTRIYFSTADTPKTVGGATGMINNYNTLTNRIDSNSNSRIVFKKEHSIGKVDNEILLLQRFLNANGFTVSKSGPGSKGNETNKFGSATRNALIKFQKKYNIRPSIGYFGPITKDIVNGMIQNMKAN